MESSKDYLLIKLFSLESQLLYRQLLEVGQQDDPDTEGSTEDTNIGGF